MLLPNNKALTASYQRKKQSKDCFSNTAKTDYILPGMRNESLISIDQLCNDNCITIFSKTDLNIFKTKN